MDYEIVIPAAFREELRRHLLTDRSREQFAVLLCGRMRTKTTTRLLARHLICVPPDGFARQTAGALELDPRVNREILHRAQAEGLDQLDLHTHPGNGPCVDFSGTDDEHEHRLARYLAERIPGAIYASVVTNGTATAARVWEIRDGAPTPIEIEPPALTTDAPLIAVYQEAGPTSIEARYDRQVRAFGPELQQRLRALTVGVVGVGGLGSLVVDQLAHLGIRDFVVIDPDIVEDTNLNRLVGATPEDAAEERAKIEVASRTICRTNPRARVTALRCTVSTTRALKALRGCDLIVAATDDDASRMVANALACQYLIPLVHAGVNLAPAGDGRFEDISGEVAIIDPGRWCLICSGIVSANRAAQDLASPEERALLLDRGYLPGTPAPAVYHLNAVVASFAATEIHNLVWPYKSLRRYLIYQELTGELMTVDVPATERCPFCSPTGLLGLGDLAPLWRPSRSRSALPTAGAFFDGEHAAPGEML